MRCSRIAVPCTHHAFTPRPDPSLHLAPPDSTRRAHPEYSLAKHHNILTFRTTIKKVCLHFMRRSLHGPCALCELRRSRQAASNVPRPEVGIRRSRLEVPSPSPCLHPCGFRTGVRAAEFPASCRTLTQADAPDGRVQGIR